MREDCRVSQENLSHVDGAGKLKMVDVSRKDPTRRVARAMCLVITSTTLDALVAQAADPDVIQSARLSGIQAAKQTSNLIPLCHPMGLDNIGVEVLNHERGLEVRSSVTTVSRTGVEMEALVACAFCALSLLDSLVGLDRNSRLAELTVLAKSGGKSDWGREVSSTE